MTAFPRNTTAGAWFGLIGIGVISTFVAVQGFYAGARRIGAAQAALVSTIEPIYTVALAALLLGERLQPVQLALSFGFSHLAVEPLDLVLRLGDPLLGRDEVGAPVLQLPPRHEPFQVEPLEPGHRIDEIGDALLRRRDDLLES